MEDGILQIVNVSHRDQGVYTCLARTPMDGDKAAALLLVIGECTCKAYYSGPKGSEIPDAAYMSETAANRSIWQETKAVRKIPSMSSLLYYSV